MSREIAIEVKKLSKHFRLPTERSNSIKQTFVNWTQGVKGYREQKVLRNISLKVEKGDFFGIVGRNGSGKSTLLKLIAGIYEPDGGTVTVNGSLVSFIELGVGFNGELTGRENIYLNGALLGFSTKEIDAMYDEIVEFAELGDFMDQKLKNYSSGMQVRLAFSCAIRAKSDILVLDEVLAVGDEAFQRKCNDYFDKIRKDQGKTVILVTHNMAAVRQYCNRALLIQKGKIVSIGDPEDVANEYSLKNLETSTSDERDGTQDKKVSAVKEFRVELLSPMQINQTQAAKVKVSYQLSRGMEAYAVVGLQSMDYGIRLFTKFGEIVQVRANQKVSHIFSFDTSQLNDFSIKVMAAVYDQADNPLAYNEDHDSPKFQIRRTDYDKRKRTTALLANEDERLEAL